jgi:GNAT superfamily N-acetyltransferase
LIGLIRLVGDGLTIIYIQDILVLENHQRQGIGRALMNETLEHYPDVRQKVLMTDDTPKTRAFYQSLGFSPCDDGRSIAFMKLGARD